MQEYQTLFQVGLEMAYQNWKKMDEDGTAGPFSHLYAVDDGYVVDFKEMVQYK